MATKVVGTEALEELINQTKGDMSDRVTVSFDSTTNKITFTALDGTVTEVDLSGDAPNGFHVGDLCYKVKQSATELNNGRWLLCNGRQVPQNEFPELYALLGTTYNSGTVAEGYFMLPKINDLETLASATSGSWNTHQGASTYNIKRSDLPNEGVFTENSSSYPNYRGEHSHRFKFKGTNKSGTDTMTVYSFSEDKTSQKWVYTNNENNSYKGRHQHVFRLNGGVSQTSISRFQPTVALGKYYIYSGRERVNP